MSHQARAVKAAYWRKEMPMKRRMTAALLALSIPCTLLAGCGNKNATEQFFDTLEEIRNLKDYHVELTVSSDEAGENGLRISGNVARSSDQAQLTVTAYSEDQEDEGVLNIVVDGCDTYLKADDWTRYVAECYATLGEGEVLEGNKLESNLLKDAAVALGDSYYKATTSEKMFELLGGGESKAADAFSNWYDGLRTELAGDVREEDGTYTLSLQEKALQEQLLSWYRNLLDHEEDYREAMMPFLKSVEDSVAISGWTDSDILDTIWSDYQEKNEELSKQKESGKWKEWSLTMTDGERGSDGAYQVNLIWKGDVERYVQARITPAEQTAEIVVPENAVSYSERAEELATVYMDSKTLTTPASDSSDGQTAEADGKDNSEPDWELWGEENKKDDTKDYSSKLNLSKLKEYTQIKSTPMESEDGVEVTLPVVTEYDFCDASYSESGNSTALYLSSDSWDVDIYNIDASDRSLEDILAESMDNYITTYQEDWGYKITQKSSKVQKSSDGSACVAGFGYYDEDKDCEVTIISLVTEMEGSSYAMDYEFALFSNAVQESNCTAVKELCDYFELDVPVTIAKGS